MQNFEQLGRELERRGKKHELETLAASEDSRRLAAMLDTAGIKEAARAGDQDRLRAMLGTVLSTEEGRRLAEGIRSMMST
ncbi:MAG: hypothetical protein IJQ36_00925 [Oscillospiraceae bacterium]|nr:hypothetical protein [Oscillospiraceae bacterium]